MAIQIKRRIGGAAGAPSTLAAGQMAYNHPATGPDALYIGDGTAIHPLVSHTRQVELSGDQTITGEKTIDIDDLKLMGGNNGDFLTTDGGGHLDWHTSPPVSVHVDHATIDGDGQIGDPLHVIGIDDGTY
jgi:hypothetical protein